MFYFFHTITSMEQLRRQNVKERNLRQNLGAENALLDSQEKILLLRM